MKKSDRCSICKRRLKNDRGCRPCSRAYRMGFDRGMEMTDENKTRFRAATVAAARGEDATNG